MRIKIILISVFILFVSMSIFPQAYEDDVYVERIEVVGNKRISAETIIYYMETREGDLYNEGTLKTDFQTLWNTGFFSNLAIKSKDGVEGKIVIVEVEEQLIVNQTEFRGLETVKSSEILEAAGKVGMSIKSGTYLDLGEVAAMRLLISEALKVRGFKSAKIDYELRELDKGRVDIVFNVTEGKSILIEKIVFEGNKYFSDWQIRDAMEELSNHNPFSFFGQKDIFNEIKFAQDRQKIIDLYWSHGFLDVKIGEPELIPLETLSLFEKQKVERYIVKVPINEGDQYRLDEVTVEGNTEFEDDTILSALPLPKGAIYNHQRIKDWLEFLKRQYGHKGYVLLSLNDERKRNPEDMTVDLNLKIKENDVYYINRINITGNIITNDEVVRRQMLIAEGDVFDNKLIEISINRIRQLGFFEPNIDIDTDFNQEEKEIDLNLKVQERSSTGVNFGIAYSELEGFFGSFSFETKNFFGSGTTFGISGQFGSRAEMFSFNYFDPWFLGERLGLGASVFIRNWDFPGYVDERIGGNVTLSYPISTFWRGSIAYGYQVANIEFPEITEEEESEYYNYYNPYYYNYYRAFQYSKYLYPEGKIEISSITNSIEVNTIDHPLFPHTGTKGMLSLEYGGTILGGSIDFAKGIFEFVKYINPFSRNVIGARARLGWIESLSDDRIPVLERFFMGGDRTIRALPIRSVGGERDENGIPTGGTKMLLFNFEYQFVISNEMRLILFFDTGNAFSEDQEITFEYFKKTAGIEARLFMPVFNVPIRLIFGFNLEPEYYEKSSDFQFSMGTMF